MSSQANLFVYSNAATLLTFGLSNTGLENVIYCSSTTDADPHSEFYSNVFISWYSLLHERHLSSINVLSNYLVPLFISKLSIEKHHLTNEVLFQRAGDLRGKNFSHLLFRSYYVICLSSFSNKIPSHIKIFKSIACLCQNDIFAQVLNYYSITLFS